MQFFKSIIITFVLCLIIFIQSKLCLANDSHTFKGYITNKTHKPIKLKIFEIDKESHFLIERNLEDNSSIPILNLKITAESKLDWESKLNEEAIFIPQGVKFLGHISEIKSPRRFNKKGFFKVTFNKATCPDGEILNLNSNLISKSKGAIYNPVHHVGKTTLGLLGGSLAGAFLTYELGGLGLAVATHGYSLAAGAAAGGFIGTVAGLSSKGKTATIELGDELILMPVDDASLEELKQVTCKKVETEIVEKDPVPSDINLEILSIKKKRDMLGETDVKININFTNNTNEKYRLNNFVLRDSQGKEYTVSFVDFKEEIFQDFPPNETKAAKLHFFIEHPKATHWLVLKNKTFNKELGSWKILN